jgi:hypothetical protein
MARLALLLDPGSLHIFSNPVSSWRVECASQRSVLQRHHAHGTGGQDDMRCQRDQFICVSTFAIDIITAPTRVDPHVAPAQLLETLLKRRNSGLTFGIVRGPIHEHADPPHRLGLFCPNA